MLKAGKELGHYRILRKLGAGGMADVYEAEDQKLGRRVALKVLPPELMRNAQLITRFQKEVRAAASLNHRSIVTVFEVGEQDDVHFYSMRLLIGGDLRSRIQAGLRGIEALAILRELAGAFEHAHGRGFVHRDVKPENVLFDEEGLPVLTDFGIAKALGSDSHMTGTGVAIGTPRYFSPEQARGRPVDQRSDLYSLGVMLYEMLTGHPPFDGDDTVAIVLKHVSEPIPKLPDEHAHLQPLLEQLMAKEPGQRMASAKDLRRAISTVQGLIGATSPHPINLGDESELVQRLLSGEDTAYQTPAPGGLAPAPREARPQTEGDNDTTIKRDAPPRSSPGQPLHAPAANSRATGAGESYFVADDDPEDATVRRAPPTRAGTSANTSANTSAPPYRPQVVSPPRPLGPAPSPPRASRSRPWKPIAATVVLVIAAGLTWASLTKRPPPPPAAQASEPSASVHTDSPAPAPAASSTTAAAPVPAGATPLSQPAAAPVATLQNSTPAATMPEEKKVSARSRTKAPAPAATTTAATVTNPQPAPALTPAPAPTPTPAPAPAPAKPVEAKTQPARAEHPAAEPASDTEEDAFLRERAEQLKRERERREAAARKAAGQALRQGQAPAPEEKTDPPPQ